MKTTTHHLSEKQIFHPGLFLDAIRQLRIVGIMTLIIYSIEAFFTIYGANLRLTQQAQRYLRAASQRTVEIQFGDLIELHPILLATVYIVAPIMLLCLFGFVNKRRNSDFFHSIPVTRQCLAITYLAAIMAWIAVIVLGSSFITCATTLWAPYVALNQTSILVNILSVLCGTFAVLCGGLIAISITGTYFSNLVVLVMLLFFPRLLLMAYFAVLDSILPIFIFDWTGGIFDCTLNIVMEPLIAVFFGSTNLYGDLSAVLYTFVLAAVYLAAGLYTFMHRKSEMAANPAQSRTLQTLFRLVPAFSITLLPMALICLEVSNTTTTDASHLVFYLALLYTIAIVVWFLYELITTHKLANIVTSLKSLWVLAASNIIFLLLVVIGYNMIIGDTPKADKVKSVTISNYYNSFDSSSRNYFINMTEQKEITNEEIISILTDTLRQNIYSLKNTEQATVASRVVEFDTVWRTVKRKIFFRNEEIYQKYRTAVATEYSDLYQNLPAYDQLSKLSLNMYSNRSKTEINSDDLKKIYDEYCEEVRSLPTEKSISLQDNTNGNNFGEFTGTYIGGGKPYHYTVYLGKDTPKTTMLALNAINQAKQDNPVADYLKYSQNMEPDKKYRLSLVNLNGGNTEVDIFCGIGQSGNPGYTQYGGILLQQMSDAIDRLPNKEITTMDTPVIGVSIVVLGDDGTNSYTCYYNASDELMADFSAFTQRDDTRLTR